MKNLRLLLVLVPVLLLFASGKTDKPHYRNFLGAKYSRINDTLFACIYEVSNEEYKQFLATLTGAEYERCKIDSVEWTAKFPHFYNAPMEYNYHIHSAFDKYPVVNITWYAASKYCRWLTYNYQKAYGNTWAFRLPSAEDWNAAAHADPATQLPYTNLNGKTADGKPGTEFERKYAGPYLQNVGYITGDSLVLFQDGGFFTVRTDAYAPNDFGLYNVIGNVAEMTNIEGLEKGGSWDDTLSNCGVNKFQHYTCPDPRVGFRVFAVLVK